MLVTSHYTIVHSRSLDTCSIGSDYSELMCLLSEF